MQRLALTFALSLTLAAPALAGPPWLTLEYRPNTFAGVVMVRVFHHGTLASLPLSGTAEGLVNGQRRSVPLTFARDQEPNVFGVAKTWGDDGVWVLNIAVTGDHLGAGAVMGFDRRGEPAFTRFPRTAVGASRPATPREVEALLRAIDSNSAPPVLGRTGWSVVVWRTVLPILVLVLLALGLVRIGSAIIGRTRHGRAAVAA